MGLKIIRTTIKAYCNAKNGLDVTQIMYFGYPIFREYHFR